MLEAQLATYGVNIQPIMSLCQVTPRSLFAAANVSTNALVGSHELPGPAARSPSYRGNNAHGADAAANRKAAACSIALRLMSNRPPSSRLTALSSAQTPESDRRPFRSDLLNMRVVNALGTDVNRKGQLAACAY